MAGEKHLRLQVSGGYTGSDAISGEVWSFNVRLLMGFGSLDDVGTFPNNWDVESLYETHTEADFVTEKTWIANGPATADFDPESYLTDQAEPAIRDFISGWKFSSRAQVRRISLYPCDSPTGNAIDGNFAHLDYTSSFPVGAGSNTLPIENSVVVSWETEKLGPRGRGRIYTPPPGQNAIDAAGLLGSTDQGDLLTASVALVEGLAIVESGLGALNVRPCVTGPTAKPGQPAYSRYAVVTGVRVGKIMDTQRRRRNGLVEAYASGDVSY